MLLKRTALRFFFLSSELQKKNMTSSVFFSIPDQLDDTTEGNSEKKDKEQSDSKNLFLEDHDNQKHFTANIPVLQYN